MFCYFLLLLLVIYIGEGNLYGDGSWGVCIYSCVKLNDSAIIIVFWGYINTGGIKEIYGMVYCMTVS